ncbi:MAG: 3-dehydroquinate synthase [Ignavibacteriaceae bacterium]
MKKIIVPLKGNPYPVYIGDSILSQLPGKLKKADLKKNIFVVIDGNVEMTWGDKIRNVLFLTGQKIFFYKLNSGESSKNYLELNKIYSVLLNGNFGRDTLMLAIGGGVTGDLAGFAASTFMRGISLIHVPTTLLAAVDSSIGGKTGINFLKKKNMIGAFYQPNIVFIDTNFFSTLPEEEIISGAGEIIKYAYLSDERFFYFILKNLEALIALNPGVINEAVIKSVSIKAAVVSQDEKEIGLRQILNFGHTFAHAFETGLNFRIKHGEAVIAGIIVAIILSNKLGLLTTSEMNNFLTLPSKIRLPKNLLKLKAENIFNLMLADKKNRDGRIKFVLLKDFGELVLGAEADKQAIFSVLNDAKEYFSV